MAHGDWIEEWKMMRNGMDVELEREDEAQFIVKIRTRKVHVFGCKLAENLKIS